ncbi:isoaspartyl peptidase/L-asparaginase family protein [Taibaiella soli]|uniref:Isoaspartyl peptidase n=1 Tax=Taibaiella soli TaxID=1649169 RepID=A0A2W2BBS8_9BACT|nr:isoaspartyl peptidase/L-asparaginase [Taibaiella soli]PZF71116.1 beta-aspartyl-peptidase [Taibaiella soli]
MPVTLVIHGGAGNIHPGMMTESQEQQYTAGLRYALDQGYAVLNGGGSAQDAVVAAITSLEDNVLFNAGRGSVFTKKGLHEMDAALMNGLTLEAGAVAGVRNIKNPIVLAREVMLHSGHVFLSGKGAGEFAMSQGITFEPDEYFFNKDRYDQWVEIRDSNFTQLDHKGDNLKGPIPNTDHKFGTVGAVACDINGNLAAGTSTGGMTNKRFARIGDSPVIGAGTYANNKTCAVSCTGHGEYFLRAVVSHDISCLMEYKGLSLQEACNVVIKDKLVKLGGEGGVIAVDALGNYQFCFNSAGMYRAMRNSEGREEIAYYGI